MATLSTGTGEADGCLCCASHFLEKCTCEAAGAAKKHQTPSLLTQLPLSSSGSPSPFCPVTSAPGSATVDSKDLLTLVHPPAPRTAPSSPADKPRELRRGREEETAENENAPKRRRIASTPTPSSSPAPATAPRSAPVPGAGPSPKVVGPQNVAELIVPADEGAESDPPDAQHSAPNPDSTPPQSVAAPERSEEDPGAAAADVTAAPRKIGIQHIQLVYEAVGETLQCRMCLCVVSLLLRDSF